MPDPPHSPIHVGQRIVRLLAAVDDLGAQTMALRTELAGLPGAEDVDLPLSIAVSKLRTASDLLSLKAEDIIREGIHIEATSETKAKLASFTTIHPCARCGGSTSTIKDDGPLYCRNCGSLVSSCVCAAMTVVTK